MMTFYETGTVSEFNRGYARGVDAFSADLRLATAGDFCDWAETFEVRK